MLLKERYTNALSFALLAFQSSLVKVPDNKTAPQLTGRRTDLNTLVVYRVLISSRNPEAVAAVHEFLKFQITEHQTGDPLEVK